MSLHSFLSWRREEPTVNNLPLHPLSSVPPTGLTKTSDKSLRRPCRARPVFPTSREGIAPVLSRALRRAATELHLQRSTPSAQKTRRLFHVMTMTLGLQGDHLFSCGGRTPSCCHPAPAAGVLACAFLPCSNSLQRRAWRVGTGHVERSPACAYDHVGNRARSVFDPTPLALIPPAAPQEDLSQIPKCRLPPLSPFFSASDFFHLGLVGYPRTDGPHFCINPRRFRVTRIIYSGIPPRSS